MLFPILVIVAATVPVSMGVLDPCVPMDDTVSRRLRVRSGGDGDGPTTCCSLDGTSFSSCAKDDGGDGVVIDLSDLASFSSLHEATDAMGANDGENGKGSVGAPVRGGALQYKLTPSTPTFDIEGVKDVEGWLVLHSRETSLGAARFVSSTIYRHNRAAGTKVGEERVVAVKGGVEFTYTSGQCHTVCGKTHFGIPPLKACSPVQLCCKQSPSDPAEFLLAAVRRGTIYSAAVVNRKTPSDYVYSSTRDSGKEDDTVISASFDLVVNPASNRFEVRASDVFLSDGVRYDADDFVLCTA